MILRRSLAVLIVFSFIFSIASHPIKPAVAITEPTKTTLESAQKMLQSQNGFFTENKGQWDPEILFVGDTPYGSITFGKNTIYYNCEYSSKKNTEKESVTISTSRVNVILENANFSIPIGLNPQSFNSFYYIEDRHNQTGIKCRNFSKIFLKNVWKDIDLAYFFSEKGLKYELYAKKTADISKIRIKIEGANLVVKEKKIELKTGNFLIADNDLIVTDVNNKQIKSNFIKYSNNSYGFNVDDLKNDIIIDPILTCSYVGSFLSRDYRPAGGYYSYSCMDKDGSMIVYTQYKYSPSQNTRIMITKFSADGKNRLWKLLLDSNDTDLYLSDLAIDKNGNIYLIGSTTSENFYFLVTKKINFNFYNIFQGGSDGFIIKISSDAQKILYSSFLGGSNNDKLNDIKVDDDENIFIVGDTTSKDFINSNITKISLESNEPINYYINTMSGSKDGFLLKINKKGYIKFFTYIGGSEIYYSDVDAALKLDVFRSTILVLGRTCSHDFIRKIWKNPNPVNWYFGGRQGDYIYVVAFGVWDTVANVRNNTKPDQDKYYCSWADIFGCYNVDVYASNLVIDKSSLIKENNSESKVNFNFYISGFSWCSNSKIESLFTTIDNQYGDSPRIDVIREGFVLKINLRIQLLFYDQPDYQFLNVSIRYLNGPGSLSIVPTGMIVKNNKLYLIGEINSNGDFIPAGEWITSDSSTIIENEEYKNSLNQNNESSFYLVMNNDLKTISYIYYMIDPINEFTHAYIINVTDICTNDTDEVLISGVSNSMCLMSMNGKKRAKNVIQNNFLLDYDAFYIKFSTNEQLPLLSDLRVEYLGSTTNTLCTKTLSNPDELGIHIYFKTNTLLTKQHNLELCFLAFNNNGDLWGWLFGIKYFYGNKSIFIDNNQANYFLNAYGIVANLPNDIAPYIVDKSEHEIFIPMETIKELFPNLTIALQCKVLIGQKAINIPITRFVINVTTKDFFLKKQQLATDQYLETSKEWDNLQFDKDGKDRQFNFPPNESKAIFYDNLRKIANQNHEIACDNYYKARMAYYYYDSFMGDMYFDEATEKRNKALQYWEQTRLYVESVKHPHNVTQLISNYSEAIWKITDVSLDMAGIIPAGKVAIKTINVISELKPVIKLSLGYLKTNDTDYYNPSIKKELLYQFATDLLTEYLSKITKLGAKNGINYLIDNEVKSDNLWIFLNSNKELQDNFWSSFDGLLLKPDYDLLKEFLNKDDVKNKILDFIYSGYNNMSSKTTVKLNSGSGNLLKTFSFDDSSTNFYIEDQYGFSLSNQDPQGSFMRNIFFTNNSMIIMNNGSYNGYYNFTFDNNNSGQLLIEMSNDDQTKIFNDQNSGNSGSYQISTDLDSNNLEVKKIIKNEDGSYTDDVLLPNPPENFSATQNQFIINLTWTTPAQTSYPIKQYQVFRKQNGSSSFNLIANEDSDILTYDDKQVAEGSSYTYYLISIDTVGNSSVSTNFLSAGPIPYRPKVIIDLSIETNKTSFQQGDDVLYKVSVHNSGNGDAMNTTLNVTFPSEIKYVKADNYLGSVQPSGEVMLNIGTVPKNSTITFQINAIIDTSIAFEKSVLTIFDLKADETDIIRKVVNCILSPKKSGDSGSGMGINVLFKNTKWDSETGEKYIDFSDPLDAQFDITGFTQPFTLYINWGDGTKECLPKLNETCQNCKHKFTSKGTMMIQITVTDATGKTKTVTAKLKVK
jgi:uncharacterized repeat protein (TIGR01451 family)